MSRLMTCPKTGNTFDYDLVANTNAGRFSPAGFPLDETALNNVDISFGNAQSQQAYKDDLAVKVSEFQETLKETYPDYEYGENETSEDGFTSPIRPVTTTEKKPAKARKGKNK